ncbi:CobW family GTP-binding protein [Pedosphaera parvula]|uniref:Cobalamin synthesis protein P47K n=1 Tax=Pedosphaera parvula (strain Ellin514) TaxID=320771 RepID=B9XIU0_PEDPL|nr:GTP-binding protein [Pedosphaera parvula]EEF60167.1 cobalamin synthesis protein P47K [Pedosphaera parvula Ellin514]
MQVRTPITIITGPLGSGKTTLLRHLLNSVSKPMAVVMNEFGEIPIDGTVIAGKNVLLKELAGGCVCCSLIGEFEAAMNEMIDTVDPEKIVLETTGVAEPEALVFDIEERLSRVRLDGIVSIMDADGLLNFPSLGHTTRMQIESADLLLLNKVDLVPERELHPLEEKLQQLNQTAPIVRTQFCHVDMDLLFGIARERTVEPPHHVHQLEFDSFSYSSAVIFDREKFEQFAANLAPDVYRAKGFIRFTDGIYLFNFVAGRWNFEPFAHKDTVLVFIGRQLANAKELMLNRLRACEEAATLHKVDAS